MTTRQKLQQIKKNTDNRLEKYVINNILKQEEPENYINDILNHGCISGTVSELIYTTDTHKFFDRFYDEIEDLRSEGFSYEITGDLKNTLAWFGFEQTLANINDQLEQ